MDINVDEIPIFLQNYQQPTKNIRPITQEEIDLVRKVKQIPNYEKRFDVPTRIIMDPMYAVIEEKGINLIEFLELNKVHCVKWVFFTYKYLLTSLKLLDNQITELNIEDIIVYNGVPLIRILTEGNGKSLTELYNEICLYFSINCDVVSS